MLSGLPLVKGIVCLSLYWRAGKNTLFLGKMRLSFSCCGCFLFVLSHSFPTRGPILCSPCSRAWPCCAPSRRGSGRGCMLLPLCDPCLPAGRRGFLWASSLLRNPGAFPLLRRLISPQSRFMVSPLPLYLPPCDSYVPDTLVARWGAVCFGACPPQQLHSEDAAEAPFSRNTS